MSGGSYDYFYSRLSMFASELAHNHRDKPHVLALANLCQRISDVAYKIEWADSADTTWTDQLDADIRAVIHPADEVVEATRMALIAKKGLDEAITRATEVA